jgi:hypothetical protein
LRGDIVVCCTSKPDATCFRLIDNYILRLDGVNIENHPNKVKKVILLLYSLEPAKDDRMHKILAEDLLDRDHAFDKYFVLCLLALAELLCCGIVWHFIILVPD